MRLIQKVIPCPQTVQLQLEEGRVSVSAWQVTGWWNDPIWSSLREVHRDPTGSVGAHQGVQTCFSRRFWICDRDITYVYVWSIQNIGIPDSSLTYTSYIYVCIFEYWINVSQYRNLFCVVPHFRDQFFVYFVICQSVYNGSTPLVEIQTVPANTTQTHTFSRRVNCNRFI
jgi:hypothetical protein